LKERKERSGEEGTPVPTFCLFLSAKEQKRRKRSRSMDEQKARKMIRERKGDENFYG
jgi:hypothetical protein